MYKQYGNQYDMYQMERENKVYKDKRGYFRFNRLNDLEDDDEWEEDDE